MRMAFTVDPPAAAVASYAVLTLLSQHTRRVATLDDARIALDEVLHALPRHGVEDVEVSVSPDPRATTIRITAAPCDLELHESVAALVDALTVTSDESATMVEFTIRHA